MQAVIPNGTVHRVSSDIKAALSKKKSALSAWQSLTPLARNEWICWCTSVKKTETRKEHIERMIGQLIEGKRRPCCWMGCIHRKDKELSPSVKAILKKQG